MFKGIKKVCSALKTANTDHYYLVGFDGKSIWVEEEFIGDGCITGLDENIQWMYIKSPMTMKELITHFTQEV